MPIYYANYSFVTDVALKKKILTDLITGYPHTLCKARISL